MKIRWLLYKSATNPETGEHFCEPSTYRKLQVQVPRYLDNGEGGVEIVYEWINVPEVTE